MSKRTIGIMGRLLDQDDGLGVYGMQLLRELMRLDPHTRYSCCSTDQVTAPVPRVRQRRDRVLPARSKLYGTRSWCRARRAASTRI